MPKKTKQQFPSAGSGGASKAKQRRFRAGKMPSNRGVGVARFGDWWGKLSKHPLYNTWCHMRTRCLTPTCKDFKNYGGRGIRICSRWDFFPNFVEDMGIRPNGLTLHRSDNDGDYEPSNCIWATRFTQNQYTRKNHRLNYGGQKNTVSEWARKLNIDCSTLVQRLERGWSVEKTVTTPALNFGSWTRKIDAKMIKLIRKDKRSGREWANALNVSPATIYNVRNGLYYVDAK